MAYTFYGGIHPPIYKTLTSDCPIKRPYIPQKVVIPLSQHTGNPAEPVVAVGDNVKVGSLIAKPKGFISSAIHASISGKISRIGYSATPMLARTTCITIEAQGDENQEFAYSRRADVGSLAAQDLIKIIADAGIVGMGGAAFPTHVKLSPPKDKKIDAIILNGAECEPYLTCDHRLMLEKTKEILAGLAIIAKILDVKDTYIAIEDNKLAAIYALGRALLGLGEKGQGAGTKIIKLKTKYPQGAEKQVIKAVLNRVVPQKGLPMDVGCVVQNIGTAFAIYEAVYYAKPLFERAVTITGDAVKEPINIWARIGISFNDLINAAGGFSKPPRKVIAGGPMMGVAQYTMDVPLIKGTSGILLLSKESVDIPKESVCIRCGRCVEVCPVGLAPTSLMYMVKKEHFKEADEAAIWNCYECGACAYTCPAKIPLVDYMKFGKAKISPAARK